MRKYPISRKCYPVRTHKKYRSVRGKFRYKYKSATERTDCVSVTLKDLGDIDVKELNTIPSSIADEEVLSWIDGSDMKTEQRDTCPNPLLQVNNRQFCPMCTAELVNICGNNTPGSDTCSHVEQTEDEVLAKARSFFEKNIMNLWNSLDEDIPVTKGKGMQTVAIINKDKQEAIRTKKEEKRKLLTRGLPPENEITCSMSKLSMQAYLCTSESSISAVISEPIQTAPSLFVWSSSSDEKLFDQSAEGGQLKLLCGELLLQLCKATAGNALRKQAPDQVITKNTNIEGYKVVHTSTSTQDGKVDDQNDTAVTELPEWLKEITGVKSQPGMHQKYDFTSQDNTEALKLKAPSKGFKPLLCTKLSVPWRGRKHSTQQHALYLKTQPKINLPYYNSVFTKSVSSLIGMNSFNLEERDKEPNKIDVPERNDLKLKKEPRKKKNKEFKEQVCPKCENSIRSDLYNNPFTMKTKPNKGRRGGRKGRSVKRNTRMSKDKDAKRRISSKPHRGTLKKYSDTKYFIKSFFTGTSSETTPKTKSKDRTSRNLLIKPITRRKKSTFTLPHSVTVGQAGLKTKKMPDEEIDVQQLPGKVRSKNNVETLMAKELKMIDKHVKAHEKSMKRTSAPMFHTCFKNILSHEFKNKGVHVRKPAIPLKDSFNHRKPRGVGNIPDFPRKIEKRKFNDSLFSCLIPRVFKHS